MPTKLVLGLQHGDEGKGRVVDDLVQNWADVVVRFQGGGNAGHTVYDRRGNKFVTHILPVGVLSKEVINIIARGCVVDIEEFCQEVADRKLTPEDITESLFSSRLETGGMPDPELIIRTSGEMRLSNFLMWQAAYAELVVLDIPWPDFTTDHLKECINEFNGRQRRFGKTGQQVQNDNSKIHPMR